MLNKNNMERDGTLSIDEWRGWQIFSHKTGIKLHTQKNKQTNKQTTTTKKKEKTTQKFPKTTISEIWISTKSKHQIEKPWFTQHCWTSGKSCGCLLHLCLGLPLPPTSPGTAWLSYWAMAGYAHQRQIGQRRWTPFHSRMHSDALSVRVANPGENYGHNLRQP